RGRVPLEGPGARRDRRRDQAGRLVTLSAENTAIVLDSTADFPEAPERFPNRRVVPLYVLFGDDSYRDYVDLTPERFYARLRTSESLPTTSQPTPGDFLKTYEELSGYERIYSLHLSAALSGTYQSARTAAQELGDKVRVVDSESASAAIAMLGLAIQRRLERGTTEDTATLKVGIAHADAPERAEQLKKMVHAERPHAEVEIVTTLGAVVGTHAGPGTVGFFWFDDRK